MKKNLLLCVVLLAGCSRGSGVYVGQVVDVGWEGFWVQTCEMEFRTSEQSSTKSGASSYDKALCDRMQESVGKKFKVRWKQCMNCWAADSPYIVESVEEVK